MLARRAWKSRKFEHELTPRATRLQPGAQTSTSYFMRGAEAEVAGAHLHDAVGEARAGADVLGVVEQRLQLARPSSPGRQNFTISTLSNWWPRLMPRTSRPADIFSRRKQGV